MYEKIAAALKGVRNSREVYEWLDLMGIPYRDESEDSGYLNLKVDDGDGMIRIYQRRTKEIVVQKWTKHRFEYSGVPTFMPGGRDTLAEIF